jgi:hypothetical protein
MEGLQPDPSKLMEACPTKVLLSGVMGGGMGLLLGVFMSAFDNMAPPVVVDGKEVKPRSWKEEMKISGRKTKAKSLGFMRSFAGVTAVWSGFDCAVEKCRGTHDLYNTMVAGCAAGASLAVKSGPQAMGFGCAGFAAFSVVIEKIMGH